MKIAERVFHINDIDCDMVVEVVSKRKDIFDFMDEYIENMQYDWFNVDDEVFYILYDDGTEDYIDGNYNGHKIKKQHIVSMVYSNPCTYIVYGNFEMNEFGVVSTAIKEKIDNTNITEIKTAD